MASEAQVEANRKNATKSTGPRSREGKMASSANATKHGGYSDRALAIQSGELKEDPDEVADFIDSILDALGPRDALEQEEARRIATINLRFRRVSRLEALAMSSIEDEPVPLFSRDNYLIDGYASPEHEAQVRTDKARIKLARQRLESVIAVASRIDAHNSRQLDQAMRRYLLLQSRDLEN